MLSEQESLPASARLVFPRGFVQTRVAHFLSWIQEALNTSF
ncbi:hypothetical protein [Pantoea sp. GD03673]|nr:hypothetical protein [Pantoea sp. GD03673]MDH2067134.1 hypothetical protein [Pantoea sp. GD03673]